MSEADITLCTPKLQQFWSILKPDFENTFKGWMIKLTWTYRLPEDQFEMFKRGRTLDIKSNTWKIVDVTKIITGCDGYIKLSKHNYFPARAFDVAVRNPQKDYVWKPTSIPQWQYMITMASKHGLVNGGIFVHVPKDYPHFEE